jgi:hypothetical protein
MRDDDLPTTFDDDVEAHLLKEALATGAAAAAVLAGAGAASAHAMPPRGVTSAAPSAAVLPDPGAMPSPKAPPIRLIASTSTKKHVTHHKKK